MKKKEQKQESKTEMLKQSLYCCQSAIEIVQTAKMTLSNEHKIKDAYAWLLALSDNISKDFLPECGEE